MPSHKNHFTFTGLNAIVLLVPAIVLFYGFDTKLFPTHTFMYMYINEHPEPKSEWIKMMTDPKRDYALYNITGNAAHDKQKLEDAKTAITRVSISNDTIIGVKIIFGKNARYNELVEALDICYNIRGGQMWMIRGNELIIFVNSCPSDETENYIDVPIFDL